MNVVSDAVEEWAASIRKSLKSGGIPDGYNATLTLSVGNLSLDDFLGLLNDPEFMQATLKEFLDDVMLGTDGEWSFGGQWQASREGDPKKFNIRAEKKVSLRDAYSYDESKTFKQKNKNKKSDGLRDRDPVEFPTERGRTAVWNTFRQSSVRYSNGRYSLGVGPLAALMRLSLSQYSPLRSNRSGPLDSLFLATEFGTGIAENVGGRRFVRLDGPSKYVDARGRKDGSWWLTSPNAFQDGARILGQRGTHFLYDRETRQPHSGYLEYFRVEFPKFLVAKMARQMQARRR